MNQITTEVVNRLIWVEVLDSDGRIGWIPATYLTIITPTSTKTPTVTLTSTGIPTNTTFVSPDIGSTFEGAEYLEATGDKIEKKDELLTPIPVEMGDISIISSTHNNKNR